MKFTRETAAAITIRNVTGGAIRIGDQVYSETLALTTAEILAAFAPGPIAELTVDILAPLLDKGPDVIVLGTGDTYVFAPKQISFALARQGIGFEVMDTAAAARTFNVLAGEGRNVAALLYV